MNKHNSKKVKRRAESLPATRTRVEQELVEMGVTEMGLKNYAATPEGNRLLAMFPPKPATST